MRPASIIGVELTIIFMIILTNYQREEIILFFLLLPMKLLQRRLVSSAGDELGSTGNGEQSSGAAHARPWRARPPSGALRSVPAGPGLRPAFSPPLGTPAHQGAGAPTPWPHG